MMNEVGQFNEQTDWENNTHYPRPVNTRVIALAGIVSLFVAFAVWSTRDGLPSRQQIEESIARGFPEQETPSDISPQFTKEYGDLTYTIVPRATYRIPGLVVSLHHSDSFTDISHEYDPANTMDICVVWGPNITTGGYQMVSYDHGDFTCYYKWSGENDPPFSGKFLSNNHMIPADPLVADQIRSINVGDQIVIEGELVDYSVAGKNGETFGHRNTSMTRDDSGNGACEIVYASSVSILKRNHPLIGPLSVILFVIGVLLLFVSFWFALYGNHRPRPLKPSNESHDPRNPFDPANYSNK